MLRYGCEIVRMFANGVIAVSLSQVVQKPSANTTVFGSAPLTLTSDSVGRTYSGEATVEVTTATA